MSAKVQSVTVSRGISLKLTEGKFIKPEVSLFIRIPEGFDPDEAVRKFTGPGGLLERLWLREAVSQIKECQFFAENMDEYGLFIAALNRRLSELENGNAEDTDKEEGQGGQ